MRSAFGPARLAAAAALAGLLGLAGTAALGQADLEAEDLPERLEEIPGLMEETMRGLLDRMKPALEDAFDLFEVLEQIDSPANYDKPVILPNGDILIRRSADAPEWDPDTDDPADRSPGPGRRNLDPNEATRI